MEVIVLSFVICPVTQKGGQKDGPPPEDVRCFGSYCLFFPTLFSIIEH